MALMRVINGFPKIRNAMIAKHDYTDVNSNYVFYNVCEILAKEGYIKGFEKLEGKRNVLRVFLKYIDEKKKRPVIMNIKPISKPSRKIYIKASDIKLVKGGLGIGIISTSKGIMTFKEAKEKNIGGEAICEVF